MAKSKNFFGLRRGSTKSLTFSVLDGKQITKDRVTEVKNPNTAGQINQRMRLAAANVIYRFWKAFIDRGQEGVSYGAKSRQAWLSQALKSPLYAPKGNTAYLPWSFPLTKGSLPSFDLSKSAIGRCENIIIPFTATAETLTDAQILENNPNLQEGDQIAIMGVYDRSYGDNTIPTLFSVKHYLNGSSKLADDLTAAGAELTLATVGIAPEQGQPDQRYKVIVVDAPDFSWNAFCMVLSRLDGSTYKRSTQDVVADSDEYFTTGILNYIFATWRNDGSAVDWPEIQGAFTPAGYKAVLMENTGTDETANVVLVYGYDEQGYKAFAVTENGAKTTGALVEDNDTFVNPTYMTAAANTVTSVQGGNYLISDSEKHLANGVISYADFVAVFG